MILMVYLAIINALAFWLMRSDKQKARRHEWRIPERVLLGAAAAGGSLGALLGMRLFRHKTRHPKFSVGIPLLLGAHIALLALLCWYLHGIA